MRLRYAFNVWSLLSIATLPLAHLLFPLDSASSFPVQTSPWESISQNWRNFLGTTRSAEPPIPPSPGGGRGDICLLAPIQLPGETLVWSDRPLFLWRGSISKLDIIAENGQVLWETTTWESPLPNAYTHLYDGPSLQPDVDYEWRVYPPNATLPTFSIPFQLLSASEHQQIATDLAVFEATLNTQQVTDAERPLAYVSFFADQNLWADALRVAFTTEHPSPALIQYQQRVLETCE